MAAPPQEHPLSLTRTGAVARLRLDRPTLHNAFDAALIAALTSTLEQLGADGGMTGQWTLIGSSAMMPAVPGYLKYVKWGLFALLVATFWLISSSYRTSFLRFIGVTLALALFAFNIPEALNCALDTSAPVEAQAVIVEMKVTAPTRKGKAVGYSVEAETDGSRLTIPMTSLDFGHYTEGDSLILQRYEGAFGIPYYDYIPGSR